jgi:uncharacterized protein
MSDLITFLSQPWHWAVSGLVIAFLTISLALAGKRFGVSSSYENVCAVLGADRLTTYFQFSWKDHGWRLLFLSGAILGGALSAIYLQSTPPDISEATVSHLADLGISYDLAKETNQAFIPTELFRFDTVKGVMIALIGGFLIGFGARWAGGCTSGHSITGMAQLQLPSLLSTVGFFIGGLILTHLLFPIIVNL